MINFQDLEAALQPVTKIGQGELIVVVNGVSITLRTLTAQEFLEVRHKAHEMAGEEASVVRYGFWIQLESLCYAICQIAHQDLRDVKYIDSGEEVEGQPIKIEKVAAMRKLLLKWGGETLEYLNRKYTELQESVDQVTERLIQYEPPELQAEVDRLELRIAELKELQQKLKKPIDQISNQLQIAEEVQTPAQEESADPMPDVVDSFEVSDEAVAAENARLLASRQNSRRPPHTQIDFSNPRLKK